MKLHVDARRSRLAQGGPSACTPTPVGLYTEFPDLGCTLSLVFAASRLYTRDFSVYRKNPELRVFVFCIRLLSADIAF